MDIEEEFTPEESAAMAAMEGDTASPAPTEPVASEAKPEGQEGAPESNAAGQVAPHAGQEPAQEQEGAQEQPDQGEPAQEKPPANFVPHQAMHKERIKRQEAEKALAELNERLAKLESPPEQEPQFVDPIEDPEGFKKYTEFHAEKASKLDEASRTERQNAQEREQRLSDAARLEAEYVATNPDYGPAVEHLYEKRVAELSASGVAPDAITLEIGKEVTALYESAKAIGMNPAHLMFIKAQEAGWAKAQSPAPTGKGDEAQLTEKERIAALANAQSATESLASSGGGSNDGGLTMEALANMSEKDYNALSQEEIDKVMRS